MDDALEKTLLIQEVLILRNNLVNNGGFDASGLSDDLINNLPVADLRTLKRELRDMVRSLGGTRT